MSNTWYRKMFEKIKTAFVSRRVICRKHSKRCEKCNSKKVEFGYYIRGYNELCKQADGDDGYYCYDCSHVSFIRSFEEYEKTLPKWCRAYGI